MKVLVSQVRNHNLISCKTEGHRRPQLLRPPCRLSLLQLLWGALTRLPHSPYGQAGSQQRPRSSAPLVSRRESGAFSLSVMHTHMGLTLVLKIGTTVHQWGWPVCNMAFECMKCMHSRCSLWSWINVSFIVQLPGVMERGRETRRGRRRVQWCPLFRMPLGMPYPLLWRSSRLFQQVRTYVYVYRMFSVYWRMYQHAVYTTTILVSSDIRTYVHAHLVSMACL